LTQPAAHQTGKIARAAGTVSVAVFASRLLGLVREQVFAAFFGLKPLGPRLLEKYIC